MAKIQARNVDDALFARIEQSAMKNERSMEGEIRLALARQYPAGTTSPEILSSRQQWQKECGGRLRALFDRLSADGFFPVTGHNGATRIADLVRIAHRLNISPGLLLDCTDGAGELTRDLAERIENRFGTSTDWLTTGDGMMFPLVTLGTYFGVSWQDFFFPDDDERYVFEFIRIDGGRHDGTLMILRQHEQNGGITAGLVTEAFSLCAGMGPGGYGNLKEFLLFLKQHGGRLVMNAYLFTPPEADFDFWSVMGQHHPVWFRDARRRSPSRWLQQLLSGEDPGEWFQGGWSPVLKDVAEARAQDTADERAGEPDE